MLIFATSRKLSDQFFCLFLRYFPSPSSKPWAKTYPTSQLCRRAVAGDASLDGASGRNSRHWTRPKPFLHEHCNCTFDVFFPLGCFESDLRVKGKILNLWVSACTVMLQHTNHNEYPPKITSRFEHNHVSRKTSFTALFEKSINKQTSMRQTVNYVQAFSRITLRLCAQFSDEEKGRAPSDFFFVLVWKKCLRERSPKSFKCATEACMLSFSESLQVSYGWFWRPSASLQFLQRADSPENWLGAARKTPIEVASKAWDEEDVKNQMLTEQDTRLLPGHPFGMLWTCPCQFYSSTQTKRQNKPTKPNQPSKFIRKGQSCCTNWRDGPSSSRLKRCGCKSTAAPAAKSRCSSEPLTSHEIFERKTFFTMTIDLLVHLMIYKLMLPHLFLEIFENITKSTELLQSRSNIQCCCWQLPSPNHLDESPWPEEIVQARPDGHRYLTLCP